MAYNCTWPTGIGDMPPAVPCGPINATNIVIPCCVIGDTCLSDNICSYTHTNVGGSGYYSAGCTSNSSDFSDLDNISSCANRCGDTGFPDIVYDGSNDIWKCCGTSSGRTCQAPSNESFIAPAPSSLLTYWLAGISTFVPSSTMTSTSIAINTNSATPTTGPADGTSASSSLSTGAKAGIGVGSAVGAIILITIGIYIIARRRRATNSSEQELMSSATKDKRSITPSHELE